MIQTTQKVVQLRKLCHLVQNQISLKEIRQKTSSYAEKLREIAERETDGNKLEEMENTENVINAHDKRTQEDIIVDQDVQGKHSSLNEAVNMNVDSKNKEALPSAISNRVIEYD
jgi:hypothetical protein